MNRLQGIDFDQMKAEYHLWHTGCKPVTEPECGACCFPSWWADQQSVYGEVSYIGVNSL